MTGWTKSLWAGQVENIIIEALCTFEIFVPESLWIILNVGHKYELINHDVCRYTSPEMTYTVSGVILNLILSLTHETYGNFRNGNSQRPTVRVIRSLYSSTVKPRQGTRELTRAYPGVTIPPAEVRAFVGDGRSRSSETTSVVLLYTPAVCRVAAAALTHSRYSIKNSSGFCACSHFASLSYTFRHRRRRHRHRHYFGRS